VLIAGFGAGGAPGPGLALRFYLENEGNRSAGADRVFAGSLDIINFHREKC